MGIRIGVDVGGTFTDVFLIDTRSGRTHRHKLPSTPRDPSSALIEGVRQALAEIGAVGMDVEFLGVGTTVSTNELLERKGAPTGLITTHGFRDLLEIGRQRRPHVYDLFAEKPKVLAPRRVRMEVAERVDSDGKVLIDVDAAAVLQATTRLVAEGVRSIAVCFINSYANPDNEARAAALVRQAAPGVSVSASHEISPEFREFERLSSVVVNAYLTPGTRAYLQAFEAQVQALGITAKPLFMNSAGGVMSPALAARRPIDTLFSGPSGGVSAARYVSLQAGVRDVITFDMGGTSTDVCIIRGGEPDVTHDRSIDGIPIRATALDVHTVGAGGSSIAWIDGGGLLHVGPQSAGADPGPACYGLGGVHPTVTDANVVLGRLHPRHLLGGRLPIDSTLARKAILERVAVPKGLSVEAAAAAILEISNHNIAQAVRHVSVERGLDPQDFVLIAFGGAGPLHAAPVASELGIRTVLVPDSPGVFCAMGVLAKDVRVDVSRTCILDERKPGFVDKLVALAAELDATAESSLSIQGFERSQASADYSLDLRYVGQNYELSVKCAQLPSNDSAWLQVREAFHANHKLQYGYSSIDRPIQIVTGRLTATIPIRRPAQLSAVRPAAGASSLQPVDERQVFFEQLDKAITVPVFARDHLAQDTVIAGPAIIEQMDTTTVVPPGFVAAADRYGNLLLSQPQVS